MAESTHSFFLRVIATDKEFFKGKVRCLTFTAYDGLRQVMAHHEDMCVATVPGELDIEAEDGTVISVVAGYGLILIAHNRVTCLVETCESEEELDKRRAEEAPDRAKERMRQKQSMREYQMTQAAMARALSRLRFKDKEIH